MHHSIFFFFLCARINIEAYATTKRNEHWCNCVFKTITHISKASLRNNEREWKTCRLLYKNAAIYKICAYLKDERSLHVTPNLHIFTPLILFTLRPLSGARGHFILPRHTYLHIIYLRFNLPKKRNNIFAYRRYALGSHRSRGLGVAVLWAKNFYDVLTYLRWNLFIRDRRNSPQCSLCCFT